MYLARVGPTRGTTVLLGSSKTYNNPRKHAFCVRVCVCVCVCDHVCGEENKEGVWREGEREGEWSEGRMEGWKDRRMEG